MTKENRRIIKNSCRQLEREEEIQGKLASAALGIATWVIWICILFA